MEIKAFLEKPYTEEERMEFIVKYNHGQYNYQIKETDTQLQALGYTDDEKQKQQEDAETERKSKLKMTKQDFFLYVLQPFNITYAQLKDTLAKDDTILACYEGCNHIYRHDEKFINNVNQMLETMIGKPLDETELNKQLDTIFEEHNAQD